jgi:hypothetical protein
LFNRWGTSPEDALGASYPFAVPKSHADHQISSGAKRNHRERDSIPQRRVSPSYFSIGREDEVISSVQTRNAAFAVANTDPTCRHVVMVGFGRDGDVHSVGKYRPNMTILQVATNRDLQIPWLKEDKTDSAFTIISEP